jgi:hypothetical protein
VEDLLTLAKVDADQLTGCQDVDLEDVLDAEIKSAAYGV